MQQDMQEHQRRAARIEALLQEVAAFSDPHARATTEELIQTLLDMYGEGLARMLELTWEMGEPGQALIETFAGDDLVAALLLLHGLHPVDIETRITRALDEVRPYLASHGGDVALLRVEDGVAYLRLQGSCHGCPSSTMTLKLAIEEAISKVAPDLVELRVEGIVEPPPRAGVPVTFVPPRRHQERVADEARSPAAGHDGVWQMIEGLELPPPGDIRTLTVQGESLLLCRIGDAYYAYHNRCSSCAAPLDSGKIEGTTFICSSCGRQYDLCRAGRCLDAPELFLQPVPLLAADGRVKIAVS
jgi:Fe-S cluster biogenesis protein NfuA/nitrite reductase/ring-hydroxylating ferredoxin subunit